MSGQDHISRTRMKKVKAYISAGRMNEAEKLCEKICSAKNADAQALSMLVDIYEQQGRIPEALSSLRRLAQLKSDDARIMTRLADTLLKQGATEEAAESLKRAIGICPEDPKLLTNYAALLLGMQRHSEAEPYLRAAIQLNPKLSQPYTNLGSCLTSQGRIEEALACYEMALSQAAPDPVMHSNYLLSCHYKPGMSPLAKLRSHQAWAEQHVQQIETFRYSGELQPEPDRQLRIGYVSPDFRTHSVAYFFSPLLKHHDRNAFKTYCYSDTRRPDETTRRLKAQASNWIDTAHLSDTELEERIRKDRIDILVDLAGHTAGNRLKVFARKPAPLQITWLGYPGTTGLRAIDYRISDAHADPAGFEAFCVEELLRLDKCFLCYEPPANAPAISPAPVLRNGVITFGSFNNLAKVNENVIALWAQILRRVSDAKLLIKNPGLSNLDVRERYFALFDELGVAKDRVTLKGVSPTTEMHLAEYREIDIALDTFPYNGTTTTCEALWMGVPVLTMTGDCHAHCVGSSLLSAAGMDTWIARSPDEYIERAVKFAAMPDLIAREREVIRSRLYASVLCDAPRFAARLEALYRDVWQRWCGVLNR